MPKESFADRLRAAMEKQNMKQVDLVRAAASAGVKLGKSHVSQYVSGKTVPRTDILIFLAQTLHTDSEWLLGHDQDSAFSEFSTAGFQTDARKKSAFSQTAESAVAPPASSAAYSEPSRSESGSAGTNTYSTGGITMREFKKSAKLDNVLYDVRGPVVEEAGRMEEAGTHVLKLNIGNPAPFGFRTPDEVIYDMRQQLTECEGYSDAKGLFSARKAIMQYAQLKHIPNVSIGDIYTGNGVSELINLSMSALLDNGDEILIPSPDYPLWTASVTLAGGTAVHYICDESSEWYPDLEDMEKKITDKTKAIVIINPNNPTGAVYPKEILEKIADMARRHELIIFSDEIYDRLLMDGVEHTSIASLCPDVFCITLNGLSKSHRIAGFRVGWMTLSGDKSRVKGYIEGLNMLSSMRLCSNVPSQYIIKYALGDYTKTDDLLLPGGRIYDQREYIYNALNSIDGLSAVKPKAAFYIFPKIDAKRFNITNDEQFVLDFLREKKILLVHGGGFHWEQPDHFRIVYLPKLEDLEYSMNEMRDFLKDYKQK